MIHASPPRPTPHRGGAPVGTLTELPPVELAAILYLRHWFSGNQEQVWRDFSMSLGHEDAFHAMAAFEDLMRAVQYSTRRPLMRHRPDCECVGGDECAFAHFVASACSGDEHDAMTFGLHLFNDVQAKCVLGAAAMCGHAFLEMTGNPIQSRVQTHPTPLQKQ